MRGRSSSCDDMYIYLLVAMVEEVGSLCGLFERMEIYPHGWVF